MPLFRSLSPRALSVFLAAACFALLGSAHAAKQQTVEHGDYESLLKGEFENVMLTDRGRLGIAPAMEELVMVAEPYLWDFVPSGNGFLVGTGNEGRVYRAVPDENATVLFDSTDTEVLAVIEDRRGNVFAGTAPGGTVYRIPRGGGAPEVWFETRQQYVWDLAFLPNGDLVVATGGTGRVYRVSGKGQGEVHYDTEQTHVNTIEVREDGIYAGTYESGLVYRITDKDEAVVLHDNPAAEITEIVFAEDGTLFFSATLEGGAPPAPPQGDAANGGNGQAPPPQVRQAMRRRRGRQEKKDAAIYRIDEQGFVDEVWSSDTGQIYSLALQDGFLYAGVGDDGMLMRIEPRTGEAALVQKKVGSKLVGLRPDGDDGLIVLGSLPGKLWRMPLEAANKGTYTSEVLDAGKVAHWGALVWDTFGSSRNATVEARQGNAKEPDDTWTDWRSVDADDRSLPAKDDTSRFYQWRVVFDGGEFASEGIMSNFQAVYRVNNRIPVIDEVTVYPQAKGAYSPRPQGPSGQQLSQELPGGVNVTYSITKRDTPSGRWLPLRGLRTIGWEIDDPDGDDLHFDVFIRRVDSDASWMPLVRDHDITFHAFDTTVFEDGSYVVKVRASDDNANPFGTGGDDEMESDPFVIDNQAPTISGLSVEPVRGEERTYRLTATVSDSVNRLIAAELYINQQPAKRAIPEDLIFDEREETFDITFEVEPHGDDELTHLVRLVVVDEDENTATQAITFE